MSEPASTGRRHRRAPVPPVPADASVVPPVDLAAIADEFGMRRAAAYLRAMGNQLPVRVSRPD